MLVVALLAAAALAGGALPDDGGLPFALALGSVLAAVGAAGAVAWQRARGEPRAFLLSPFPIAAATWLVLFVLRPLELYAWPDHTAIALGLLGFESVDLTRTTALGAVGCAAWCGGYLAVLGRDAGRLPQAAPLRLSGRGAAAALAVGTVLWALLFQRQGGFGALLESAASVRVNQGGSFYAFVGVWMVEGVTLAAFAALLNGRTRVARWVFVAGLVSSLAASAFLQLRSLAAFGIVAGIVVYLALRRPGRRFYGLAAAAVVLGALVLGVSQQVRGYSTVYSTREAVALTARTPLSAMYVSDLSTFDNFVAMQQLVPESIPPLEGRTLAEIPLAFVPRAVWPGKPLGIDFRVSSYLYPGVPVAVPISFQGELFWNGGLLLVAVGGLLLGAAIGLAARLGLSLAVVAGPFLLYAVTLPFVHGLVTRGLATTLQNLFLALLGVGIAVALTLRRVSPASPPSG